jgi:ABC-type uncharacterized transport system involved in gliding motility auxiliary subunit
MSAPSLRRRSASLALLAAGAVFLGVGLVVALPIFGPSPLGLLGVIVGGASLTIGAALAPTTSSTTAPSMSSTSSTSSTSWARKTGAAIPIAAACVLAGLAVVAGARVPGAIDVTRAAVNTLAPESEHVAKAIGVDLRIVAFIDDDRTATELVALVERYRAHNARISFERRSVRRAEDSDLARQLGVAEYLSLGGPNVVVAAEDPTRTPAPVRLRFDAGQPDHEERLTNALRRATSTTTTKVYVVTGHGEAELSDEGPAGLSRLRKSLASRGVELVPLPLALVGVVPDDATTLMLVPGTVVFSDVEARAVNQAIERGVSLLVALDPDRPSPQLASWAAARGVDVVDDVVIDESPFATMLGGADVASGQTQLGHPITRPLRGALTHFPRASVVGLSPVEGVEAVPIVSTGPDATSPKTGAKGPLPLVVAAAAPDGLARRAVVCADATFLENAAAAQGANHDLAMNAVMWLSAVDDQIAVRPRSRGGSLVLLTPSGRSTLTFVVVVLIPALLWAAAAAWSAIRRSR